ncbi:hypothetical protein E1264_18980 [Actinomadura sp. KC216]|uniref:hypothetical protein n=1 Tax=Actinomadura sp. KC216 TaxID=2530370 RepID=UPI00104B4EE2|nr:hypothetical protein [Actinomadura sp. KC216]TDB86110.1 hypothetical protein E1264_18980 [Actinomadura sp. KC216]
MASADRGSDRLARARMRAERRRPAEEPAADPAQDWTQRLATLSTFGPPTTIIAGVLIWYGYVATLQRFRYFGVDLQLTELANQDLLKFGVEVAYPAAALLLLIVLVAMAAHALIGAVVLPSRPRLARGLGAAIALTGLALLVRALVGLLSTDVARNETPGVTPLSLTACAPLLVYGFWLARHAGSREPVMDGAERGARLAAIAIGVMGLFWAANSLAGEVGVARAYDDAKNLGKLPEVVLYTKEPLVDAPRETEHADFGEKVAYRHRYRNLRLLLASGGRLFLVPLTWKPTDSTARISTFVIPYDENVRLQLIPQRTD